MIKLGTAKRSGRVPLTVLGVVLIAVAAVWLVRGMWGGGGSGTGTEGEIAGETENTKTPPAEPTAESEATPGPGRPLVIQIDGHDYRIGGRAVTLEQIVTNVGRVPAGDGPAVRVERLGTSRVTAETDLAKKLDELGVRAEWVPPLQQ